MKASPKPPPTVTATPPSLHRWVEWKSFQREHANIFPTPQSFDWFIRANQSELAKRKLLTKFQNIRRVDAPGVEALIEQAMQDQMARAA